MNHWATEFFKLAGIPGMGTPINTGALQLPAPRQKVLSNLAPPPAAAGIKPRFKNETSASLQAPAIAMPAVKAGEFKALAYFSMFG